MRRARQSGKLEPVISLINIVFLILIFFMVAGTLSRQSGNAVAFVQTTGLECCVELDALSVSSDGSLSYMGAALSSPDDYLDILGEGNAAARLAPDQDLPARRLLEIVRALQAAGAERVVILTESAPE